MKTCSLCGIPKALTSFRRRKEAKDGLRNQCAVCEDLRKKKWCRNHPEKWKRTQKASSLKSLYGLSMESWNLLFRSQNGQCYLCSRSGVRLSVDHCHTSGRVRGLLCQKCNAALGLLDDSPERLRAAAAYLERP